MNLREKLLLHTDLSSEQIHTFEKVLEHLCFFRYFYDDLKIITPGRVENQIVTVSIYSNLNMVPFEDENLIRLFSKISSNQTLIDVGQYTPVFFNDNQLMALVTYREKKCSNTSLDDLINCCIQDAPDIYPINYLIPDGIIIIDATGKMSFANYLAQNICRRLGIPTTSYAVLIEALGITHQVFRDFLYKPAFMSIYLQIGPFDISIVVNPLFIKGEFAGAFIILSDLTLIKKKERELIKKSAVIKEIHHRVKNNLQTITSLLRLQKRRTNSEKVEKALNESINRILSIALIHEALSHQELEIINIKQTVYRILEMILANMVPPNKTINGEILGQDVYLNALQASNLSLCITELIQNAVEHAFSNQIEGIIRVSVEQNGDEVHITVEDNGAGISSGGFKNVRSLGMQIVDTITQNNLNGRFSIKGSRAGTVARIEFPACIKEGGD